MTQNDNDDRARPARYVPANMALHWLSAILVLAAIIIAWIMTALPSGATYRIVLYQLHKSLGLTIWFLTLSRLVLRFRHSAPLPIERSPYLRRAAAAVHGTLYALLFVVPITGYAYSSASGHPVAFWGVPLPAIGRNELVAQWGRSLHLGAQWAFYGLLLAHFAAVVWHVWFKRDGLLGRMIPEQRTRSEQSEQASTQRTR